MFNVFFWFQEKSLTSWYKDICMFFPMEQLKAKVKGNDNKFMEAW